jgi:hypothetical protein
MGEEIRIEESKVAIDSSRCCFIHFQSFRNWPIRRFLVVVVEQKVYVVVVVI